MIQIDLLINSLPIELNKPYPKLIKSGKLKKVSFLLRKQMKLKEDESVYWVKNPSIDCFHSEFAMYPPIGVPNLRAEQMFGTSAYFYFNKKDVLIRISFQLIQNTFLAKNALQLFRSICGKSYGVPKAYGDVNGFIKFTEWEDNDSELITELSDSGKHFYIHWFLKQDS